MVKPNIIESVPMTIAEVKDELAKIHKRDEELNFRSKKTEEYVNYVPKLTGKKVKELYAEIDNLKIPRIKDTHIKKFIDLLPVSDEDAKVILQGQPVSINKENLKKIVDTIDKYR